jgi:hypothetical protein
MFVSPAFAKPLLAAGMVVIEVVSSLVIGCF